MNEIFFIQVIYSLLFHVDISTFQTYVGYEIRRCELILLKRWNFRPDAKTKHKYRHNLKEAYWHDNLAFDEKK